MNFYVPAEKIRKIKRNIHEMLHHNTVTSKELAKLAGTLASMHLTIGPLVRLFTRSLYHQIACSPSWYTTLQLTPKTIGDLKFWLQNIDHVNGYRFKPHPTTMQMVFTDPSGDGYGDFTVHRLQKLICSGKFTFHEKQQSFTFRELLAVKLVLQS